MSSHSSSAGNDTSPIERALRAGPDSISGGKRTAGERTAGGRTGGGRGAKRTRSDFDAEAASRRLTARIAAEGLADVSYAPIDSPFGTLRARGDRARARARSPSPRRASTRCSSGSPSASPHAIVEASAPLERPRRELEEYFDGRRQRFELALDWTLIAPFARRVLRATAEIPYGSVLSYGEVAAEAGSPRGSRAAGNALGRQPDPDRRALPPRAAQRRRARRLRRRSGAQALAARARGRERGAAVSGGLDRRRRPLGLGEVADGHALGRRHAGRCRAGTTRRRAPPGSPSRRR